MVKTLEQLRKDIAAQKRRIGKEQTISKSISERQKLSRELFELKHKKLIGAGAKAKRLSKRFGRGLLEVGKRAAPVVKKQIKLIRAQQLRDEAIERSRKKPKIKKSSNNLGIFESLDF